METSVDDPYLRLAQKVSLLSRALERVIDPVLQERCGITGKQLIALRLIERGETNPMRVAERAALPPSSASRMLDAMVEAGLLARSGDPDDRRKTVLTVTPRGSELGVEARRLVAAELRAAYAHVSMAEVQGAVDALSALVSIFDKPVEEPEAPSRG